MAFPRISIETNPYLLIVKHVQFDGNFEKNSGTLYAESIGRPSLD